MCAFERSEKGMEFYMKTKEKTNKGITLVALVVTIIILLILAGVGIQAITNTSIFEKTGLAKEKNDKSVATETMNLKITNIQISSYAEKKELPSLQYLADKLCEDNDIEYVLLESNNISSLEKVNVTNGKSIYTKLKEYPYEFEINSDLQLASVDGVKIEKNNEKCSRYIAVNAKGTKGKLKMKVNIPDEDNSIIKSIDYYIDNKMVYSGKEKSYTVTGLEVDKEYEVYAIVNYDTTKISSTAISKSSDIEITEGLVGYWPLKENLIPEVSNELIGNFKTSKSDAVPDFSQNAYKMNTDFYLKSEKVVTLYENLTIACQFKLNSISSNSNVWGSWNLPFGSINNSSSFCYGIFINSSESRLYNGEYGYGNSFSYNNYVGNWINAVLVQDSNGNSTLYYNGNKTVSGANGVRNTINFVLGNNCDGYMKNFAIYNRVLSEEEVKGIYGEE